MKDTSMKSLILLLTVLCSYAEEANRWVRVEVIYEPTNDVYSYYGSVSSDSYDRISKGGHDIQFLHMTQVFFWEYDENEKVTDIIWYGDIEDESEVSFNSKNIYSITLLRAGPAELLERHRNKSDETGDNNSGVPRY